MKKQITIFALTIFFFAQFGKVINYCYCKAVVYEQTKSFICDCEKKLYSLNTDKTSREQPAQNIAAQLPSEELFHVTAIPSFTITIVISFTTWPKSNSEALYHVFNNTIFHPPLAIA